MSPREKSWLSEHLASQLSMSHISLEPSHSSRAQSGYNPQNLSFNSIQATGQPSPLRMYPPRGELIRHREHTPHQPHFDSSLDSMTQHNFEHLPARRIMNLDCQPPLKIPTDYCRGIVNANNQLHFPRNRYSTQSLYCQSSDNTTSRLFHRVRPADDDVLATPTFTFDDKHLYPPHSLQKLIMSNKRSGEPLAAKIQPATKHPRRNSPQILTEKFQNKTIDLTGGEDTVQQPVLCNTNNARPDVQAGRMEYVDGDWKRKELNAVSASKLTQPMSIPTSHIDTANNDKNVVHPHTDIQNGNIDIDQNMSNFRD